MAKNFYFNQNGVLDPRRRKSMGFKNTPPPIDPAAPIKASEPSVSDIALIVTSQLAAQIAAEMSKQQINIAQEVAKQVAQQIRSELGAITRSAQSTVVQNNTKQFDITIDESIVDVSDNNEIDQFKAKYDTITKEVTEDDIDISSDQQKLRELLRKK